MNMLIKAKDLLNYNAKNGQFTVIKNGKNPVRRYNNNRPIIVVKQHRFDAAKLAWYFVHGQYPLNVVLPKDHVYTNLAIDNLYISNRRCKKSHDKPNKYIYLNKHGTYSVEVSCNKESVYLGAFKTINDATFIRDLYISETKI